ncbi:hypothetical protein [Kosakonia sp. WA-90]|uniref:hypothetical protein n=1 Tax=Kosakonia sp. WA-90 TaxID=3153576 RepID=UPI000B08DB90
MLQARKATPAGVIWLAGTKKMSLPYASGKAAKAGLPVVSPSRERGGIGIHLTSGKVVKSE